MRKSEKPLVLRLIRHAAVTVLLLSLFVGTAYAWFSALRIGRSDKMDVDIPPIIYIRDDSLEEMVTFHLDGLQIKKDYASVFCVAPAFLDAVDHFDLGVIYTENIGMKIDLYPVTSVTAEAGTGDSVLRVLGDGGGTADCYFHYTTADTAWTADTTYGGFGDAYRDPSNPTGDLNRGVYKMYADQKFYPGESTATDLYGRLNDTTSYRFYVLCVTWQEDLSEAELEKETDVVYIVSKGTAKRSD